MWGWEEGVREGGAGGRSRACGELGSEQMGPPPAPHRSGEVPWRNKATVFPEKYTGSGSC